MASAIIPADEASEPRAVPRDDRERFERLVVPCHAAAMALAIRLMGNSDDADDALQDALVKAWRHLPLLRERAGFRSWFLRIVFHQCLDARRRRSTRRRHEQRVRPARTGRSADPVAERDELRRVREVMDELPPKQRAALHLRVFEEMGYDEISAVLGLTPRSARVYVVKARRHLRERLAPEGGP